MHQGRSLTSGTVQSRDYSLRQFLSVLSLILASAAVCHCIFEGTSAPPHSSGTMWSTT